MNKIFKSNVILLLVALLYLSSCTETTPTAQFTASTTNTTVGDKIYFTNDSRDADHYEWDFGDGSTSTQSSPSHTYYSKGVYYVQMTAYSPKGKKSDRTGMSINVTEATGEVMFWQNSAGYIVTVEVDGVKKEINKYYPYYNPDCGDEGCATFNNLTVGDHYWYAECYDGWWSGYVTIEKNTCIKKLLLNKKASPFKDGDNPSVDKRMSEEVK